MPKVFKFGAYSIYFWVNEGKPLEPIHLHVSEGNPVPNATKIWITSDGRCLICNNNSKIPRSALNGIIREIEHRIDEVIQLWHETFGEIKFYC